jgi:hypothetical protein
MGFVCKHHCFSECNFFGFRRTECLLDRTGFSTAASEAGAYLKVNLSQLRVTELRSMFGCRPKRCSYFLHTVDHTPLTTALQTLKMIPYLHETECGRVFTAMCRRMVVICHWIAGNCRVVGNAVHISTQFTSGTTCIIHGISAPRYHDLCFCLCPSK